MHCQLICQDWDEYISVVFVGCVRGALGSTLDGDGGHFIYWLGLTFSLQMAAIETRKALNATPLRTSSH